MVETFPYAGPPNKRMHATRDTTAVKILNRACGRVMLGVRCFPRRESEVL